MITYSETDGALVEFGTAAKWDRAADLVLRKDRRTRQPRGQRNHMPAETVFVQITSNEANNYGLFDALIITPNEEEVPEDWAGESGSDEEGDACTVAFANVDPDMLCIMDEPIYLARRVGLGQTGGGEVLPLMAVGMTALEYRGILTEEMTFGSTAEVDFYDSDGATGVVRDCKDHMLGADDELEAGTEVTVALMPGDDGKLIWYVTNAGCEASESPLGGEGGGSMSYTPAPYFPSHYFTLE